MRWPKYLDRYPASVIAARTGVTEATVKRWRRKGEIPARRTPAARSVKAIRMVPTGSRKAKLRRARGNPEYQAELAYLADVPVSTVKRWIRAGDIPVDHRFFLADTFHEPRPPKRIVGPAKLPKQTTKYYTWQKVVWGLDNQELTKASFLELVDALNRFRPPQAGTYQFGVKVYTNLEDRADWLFASSTYFDTEAAVEKKIKAGEPMSGTIPVDKYAGQYDTYQGAKKDFLKMLMPYFDDAINLWELTLFMKTRLKK